MTKYEKLKNLIYKYREEEKKVINLPDNLWGEECYMTRCKLQKQLDNLTLAEAMEIV